MTININELRRKANSTDVVDHIDLHANIRPLLSELIDRLEAAESERDELRAKIDQLEEYTKAVVLAANSGAQPTPSVPGGWLRAIDAALVVAHIGVANADDTYEQAKSKLDNLIGFHVDVATDPAVNGGYKLMPVEPTIEIYECFAAYDGSSYSNPFDFAEFSVDYRLAIEAAPNERSESPETKP